MHGNEPTAALSAALTARGVDHVAVGLSESYGEALSAIAAMLAYAQGAAEWEDVLLRMAVFVTSAVRSKQAPPLAQMLAAGTAAGALAERLGGIRLALRDAGDHHRRRAGRRAVMALTVSGRENAPGNGPARKPCCWSASAPASTTPFGPSPSASRPPASDSFTEIDAGDTAPVQVMNLHQTKGREADAVIIAFRNGDYHGTEGEPFPAAQQAPVRDPHQGAEPGHPAPPSRSPPARSALRQPDCASALRGTSLRKSQVSCRVR